MRAFVFWIWAAFSSLGDGLGAPPRVAVSIGLALFAGVVAGVISPALVPLMTHARDRIAVLQQARGWTQRRPTRAERARILRTHGIRVWQPLFRTAALVVPVVIGTAFATASTDAYVDDWADADTRSAFTDFVDLAEQSPTDTGFLIVFGGTGIASVFLAYAATRVTASWRLARLSLSYAPTFYALACAASLLGALSIASPLLLGYAAALLFWLLVSAVVTAIAKAPKTFVPALLDTSEHPTAAPEEAPPELPTMTSAPPTTMQPHVRADGTRALSPPADAGGETAITPATPMLRCKPLHRTDPQSLGAYRIYGRLGSGAMGTVFLAVSPHGQQVALKVLSPALAGDNDSRRRFFRELHALQHIDNPRVVGVVDSGVVDDTPFIAMTAIEGPDLATRIRDEEPLGTDDLALLAEGLAEGLAAVHEQGLVHRDVKPSNIIWSENGPCLVDFGLAHLGDQTRVTSTGMVIGSPSYVSPERLRGITATPASDVWNWAACLAYAATGDNLYRSDDPAALWHRILNHDYDVDALARLRVLGPDVFALVEDCLRTEPSERPRDGGDLLRRYRQASATTPQQS